LELRTQNLARRRPSIRGVQYGVVRFALAAPLACALVLGPAGCARDTTLPDTPRPEDQLPYVADAPPGVPPGFSFLYDRKLRWSPNLAARSALPFDSITLERSAFGPRGRYRVVLTLDGSAVYDRVGNFGRTGKSVGQLQFYEFAQLALLAERI